MACFLVSAAEAAVVSAAAHAAKKQEKLSASEAADHESATQNVTSARIPLSRKLHWLAAMLWGGALLLAFEHVWHGEVVPWFPFLSAMSAPAEKSAMLHEMATRGVVMALLVTGVWAILVLITNAMEKRALAAQGQAGELNK